jgi:vitamin B12 transporter
MIGNPGIKAETSRGWDAGIEQTLASGRVVAGITYFENKYKDLIEWSYTGTNQANPYEGRMVNRARASTRGVETSVEARLGGKLSLRAAYTYLDARNDGDHSRLTRRPRQVGDAEARMNVTAAWIAGAGLHVVTDRMDGSRLMEDYGTVRLFTSYEVLSGLRLKLRVENLLDKKFEEVYGYPALPVAYYGGVEWRF